MKEAERMLEAQQDLSPEVTLALISSVRRDSFWGANSHRHDLPRNIDAGFLLVVGDWAWSPQSSPEPSATMIFEELLLGLLVRVVPPSMTVRHDRPNTRVWLDVQTGLITILARPCITKRRAGLFITQGQMQLEHFSTAARKLSR